MKVFLKNIALIFCCALFTAHTSTLIAQEEGSQDKKIIIIQETTDAFGNKTTRKTTLEGDVSEEEIERILNENMEKETPHIIIDRNRSNFYRAAPRFRDQLRNRMYFHDGDHGSVLAFGERPTLGVYLNTEQDKMVVTSVMDGSGAKSAGIQEGDIIVSIDGEEISDIDDIRTLLKDKDVGDKVEVILLRDDEEVKSTVELKSNEFGGTISRSPRWNQNQQRHRDQLRNLPFGILQRPKLGLMVQDAEDGGVLIEEVTEDSPAAKAGLKEGDVITKYNGEEVKDADQLIDLVRQTETGESVDLEYNRDGKSHTSSVKLAGKNSRKRF